MHEIAPQSDPLGVIPPPAPVFGRPVIGVFSHPWVTFIALSLLFFLVSAATFSSLGVVLPAMVRELKWNWAQAGLGYTFLGLSCGLSSVGVAALVRRVGVRATLLGGSVLLLAGFSALALDKSLAVYLAATLVIGLAFSLTCTVPGTHVLTGLFRRRSTVLGAYFTIGALGGVAGPLLYVAIAPALGWRAYWWVFAAGAAVLGLFAVAASPGREGSQGPETAPIATGAAAPDRSEWTVPRGLATVQFYVIVGAYTMYLLINTTAHGFAVEHLMERGISRDAAAFMLSLEALIGAAVSVIGGIAGEKVRPKTLLIVCLIAIIIGMSALAWARGWPLMLVYAFGVGIGFGLSFVASTMLLLTYYGRRPYLELYSVMCLISTAAAIGPAVGGWARDALGSFSDAFLLCAGLAFLMLIATIFMRPPSLPARSALAKEGV
ncbi:MAG: CynX/NimT family MFS transporter [Caulobacteraceae bacterium]